LRLLKHWRCGSAAAYAVAFALPWAKTGNRVRSGYNLAGVIRQAQLVPNRLVGIVILCVLVMPLLAAATVAADLTRAARTATWSLVGTTVVVAFCVVAVGLSESGPRLAAAAVAAAALGVVATRPRRLSPSPPAPPPAGR
jgi:hypothetical protein